MDTGDDELFGSGADEAAAGGKGKKRKGGDKGEGKSRAAGMLQGQQGEATAR
jgi:hypothetical protein